MSSDPNEMAENVLREFEEVEKVTGWPMFYQTIRNETSNQSYEINEAKKAHNKKLNRYQDVNPFDHSRIILRNSPCDYINASLVSVQNAHRKYILAQGPLAHTTPHFWLMVWEQKSKAIIMLNRVIEKNMVKCHQYWPATQNSSFVFNEEGLKVTNVSEESASYYKVTTLNLEELATGSTRQVMHFHYTTWPDFGCPQSPTAFLLFLWVVRNSGALDDVDQPAVVHCSAGIGRSGTFCLVDSCLRMIKELHLDNVVVKDVLLEMRQSRMGLVQTSEQLRFSYLAIIEGLTEDTPANGNVCEIEEEEEAPPLPPPRAESLRSRQSANAEKLRLLTEETKKKERLEKKKELEKKVQELRTKMKEMDHWQEFKRAVLKPLGFGFILIGGGFFLYTWFTRR